MGVAILTLAGRASGLRAIRSARKVDGMTTEGPTPRCADCDLVLRRPGAICHACDVETHFEGALRTAPPLFTHQRERAQQQRSDLRAS